MVRMKNGHNQDENKREMKVGPVAITPCQLWLRSRVFKASGNEGMKRMILMIIICWGRGSRV